MVKESSQSMEINSEDMYIPGNPKILPFIDQIIDENIQAGSGIRSFENLEKLADLARGGASCLLLLEHYSNFDLPVFSYLLRKHSAAGADIEKDIVAVAGIKLSQTDPIISAFAEGYSRLVIYPSRSLEIIKNNIKDPKELVAEMMRGSSINRTAMKTLGTLKHQGKFVLVFPAGTRFRPWDPSSKRGVREMDSYLKSFDYMCLVAVSGNMLRINPEGIMREDLICPDRVLYDISEPLHCGEFRDNAKHHKHFGEDKKQAIVDSLMASLEAMHEKLEKSVES
jgi:hypothetical protein